MRISKLNQVAPEVRLGSLLCATPFISRAEQVKSLVLVTRHSSLGSIGIILNKSLGVQIHVSSLSNDSKILKLHYGGIEDEGLSFLVSMPVTPEGWRNPFYWCSNFNDLKTILGYIDDENVIISAFTGCIRWLPGELEEQVSRKQWWITNQYALDDISGKGDLAWFTIAKKTGGHFAPLLEFHNSIMYN
jgi:putative transcriptional regulator